MPGKVSLAQRQGSAACRGPHGEQPGSRGTGAAFVDKQDRICITNCNAQAPCLSTIYRGRLHTVGWILAFSRVWQEGWHVEIDHSLSVNPQLVRAVRGSLKPRGCRSKSELGSTPAPPEWQRGTGGGRRAGACGLHTGRPKPTLSSQPHGLSGSFGSGRIKALAWLAFPTGPAWISTRAQRGNCTNNMETERRRA